MQQGTPALQPWLAQTLGTSQFQLEPLKGDASFRSYYRVRVSDFTHIVMVAPPERERTDAFVSIARQWQQEGLQVPHVLAWEQQKGFVLLSDFGDTLLLEKLTAQTVESFYQEAMQILLALQRCPAQAMLPPYDADFLQLELSYFREWFIDKLLQLPVDAKVENMLAQVCAQLVSCCVEQPQVIVHRDFHSRNLMVLPQGKLGIIDFQDAMIGPVSYDLVSLLRDCYISWPLTQVHHWVHQFQNLLTQAKQLEPMPQATFLQWFDWTGLQRHLKVLGIFSRLKLRDNKPHYLLDIPRVMHYVLQVSSQYAEFEAFADWMRETVVPRLTQVWQEHNLDEAFKVA